MTIPIKIAKGPYTEAEAAEALGVPVDEFRKLIREHITDREEDLSNLPAANFHASDLLVLRMILSSRGPH